MFVASRVTPFVPEYLIEIAFFNPTLGRCYALSTFLNYLIEGVALVRLFLISPQLTLQKEVSLLSSIYFFFF